MKLVALSGSLRAGSFSTAALCAALAIAQRAGAQTSLCDLREIELPLFQPEAKNALDYMELLRDEPTPYLQGKAVGLIALSDASPHTGMAACVTKLRGWLAPTRVTLHAADFDASSCLSSVIAQRRVKRLVEELLHFAAR